jgi:hypothetical protein
MSDRILRHRTALWLVRCTNGAGLHLFSGTLREMAAHISQLHRTTGRQHAACELDP